MTSILHLPLPSLRPSLGHLVSSGDKYQLTFTMCQSQPPPLAVYIAGHPLTESEGHVTDLTARRASPHADTSTHCARCLLTGHMIQCNPCNVPAGLMMRTDGETEAHSYTVRTVQLKPQVARQGSAAEVPRNHEPMAKAGMLQ